MYLGFPVERVSLGWNRFLESMGGPLLCLGWLAQDAVAG